MADFLGTCRGQGWIPVMRQQLKKALAHYRAELDKDLCRLEWWRKDAPSQGLVAKLAFKYVASPAMNVPCELLFSLSGHVVNNKRASLSPDNTNRLVCLRIWLNDE